MKEKLVNLCINSAIEYCTSSLEIVSNHKKTNKLYKSNRKNFCELKKETDGIIKLKELLNHENHYVRYNAAIYLLSEDEILAKKSINSLKGISKALDFNIHYLLDEWDKGKLRDFYS